MCLKKFIKLSIGAKQIDVWYFIFNATSFKKNTKMGQPYSSVFPFTLLRLEWCVPKFSLIHSF